MSNEAAELWEEYDNVAYFVGAAYASPQEEARLGELKVLILSAERKATVERIRAALTVRTHLPDGAGYEFDYYEADDLDALLDAEAERET